MELSLREYLSVVMTIARDTARRCGLIRDSSEPPTPTPVFTLGGHSQHLIGFDRSRNWPNGSANENHRTTMQRGLRAALMARRIVVYYEPVVALERGHIIRFEGLPRWESNDFGWVERDQLVALAEEAGFITELNDQLLNQACQDARNWPDQVMLAVHISPLQVHDGMLASRIVNVLSNTGFNPRRLQLEVTEPVFSEPNESGQGFINQLRQVGVKLALDDFGTGYAPLIQLLDFQFDRIKIDRRFVEHLGKDNDSAIIVRAITRLAHDFGIVVTAKGIETAEHLTTLIASGCEEGQGVFFGGPVPASEVPVVLDRTRLAPVRQLKSI
jgi:EAL domain-containing protein (putative c-di-GMP-specific phosphodiesterase class I)